MNVRDGESMDVKELETREGQMGPPRDCWEILRALIFTETQRSPNLLLLAKI